DVVGGDHGALEVEQLDADVAAEVPQRDGAVALGAVDEVGPRLELAVVGDAALERDVVERGATGRVPVGADVVALAVADDGGGPLERAELADAGDHPAVLQLDPELEVLVRVDAGGVDGELCHVENSPRK